MSLVLNFCILDNSIVSKYQQVLEYNEYRKRGYKNGGYIIHKIILLHRNNKVYVLSLHRQKS